MRREKEARDLLGVVCHVHELGSLSISKELFHKEWGEAVKSISPLTMISDL